MEVKLNTIQAAIASDNFATLEKVSDLYYLYRFSLTVSKAAAAAINANSLTLRTYLRDPKNEVSLSVFKQPKNQTLSVLNLNARHLIQNIQRRNFAATSDINTTRNSYLTINNYAFDDLINTYNTGVGYTLIEDNTTKDAVGNEVYNTANTLHQDSLRDDRNVTQLSMVMLHEGKVDPANAARQKVFSTGTPYESNSGVSTNFMATNPDPTEQSIIANLLTNNLQGDAGLPTVQTYRISDRDNVTIHFTANLPVSLFKNLDFYTMFSIYDVNKNLVQEFVKAVSHKNNLSMFKRVKSPPIMSITKGSGGQLNLTLQQVDPFAVGVKIYKTVYNGTGNNDAAMQEFVGNYDLDSNKIRVVELQNNSVGLILFRALAYGSGENVSSDFSSAVIEVYPNDVGGTSKQDAFVILRTQIKTEGLSVTVSEIPNDIAFVRLFKADITQDPYAVPQLLTTFFVGGVGSLASYEYLDNAVSFYGKYQYTCELVDIKGQEYPSSGVAEVYYRNQMVSYATVTATNPVITPVQFSGNSAQYYDVTFNIAYAITAKLEDNVKTLLANQGLSEYFGANIDRDSLRDLLVTKVELRDLHTNDIYFMGYTDKQFTQSATTFGLLSKNSNYTYVLTTYVRAPRTLLQTVVQTGTSTNRPNGKTTAPTYTYVPFNLEHPYGLLTGTNPKTTGDEFVTQYGLNQLGFGAITSVIEVPVNLKPPVPTVNNVKAFLFNSASVEITWSVNGSQDEISHFIIRRENIQTKKLDLIGRSHGVNVLNAYSYVDPIRYTETGIFRYIITMQYTDMSLSQDYMSNEVTI